MILRDGRKVASVRLDGDRAVARARKKVSDIMQDMGARPTMQTRFVTAVSEIARNAVVHGGGGTLDIFRFSGDRLIGVAVSDHGPGIADLDAAFEDGFTTMRGSMGRGLGGARRLAREIEVESSPGTGTIVRLVGQTQLRS